MAEDLLDVVHDHDVAEVRGHPVRVRVQRSLQPKNIQRSCNRSSSNADTKNPVPGGVWPILFGSFIKLKKVA